MTSWQLADADEIAAENKYTFYKPSRAIIERVQAGQVVKLIFRFESNNPDAPAAERMWVMVDEVQECGRFKGRLDNEPRYIRDLQLGDAVAFAACHIINTEYDDENIVEPYVKRCFVTRRVLYEGHKPAYLYREDPDDDQDSGWRITANTENDEYMADASNIAYVSLGAVLNKDDSFLELLEQPVGSAFVLDQQSGAFVPVSDEV